MNRCKVLFLLVVILFLLSSCHEVQDSFSTLVFTSELSIIRVEVNYNVRIKKDDIDGKTGQLVDRLLLDIIEGKMTLYLDSKISSLDKNTARELIQSNSLRRELKNYLNNRDISSSYKVKKIQISEN